MKKFIISLLLILSLLCCAASAAQTDKQQGGPTTEEAVSLSADQIVLGELTAEDAATQLQYYAFVSTDAEQFITCTVENLGSNGNSQGFRLRMLDQDGACLYESAVGSGNTVVYSGKIPADSTVYAEIYGYYNAINGSFRIQFGMLADAEGDNGTPIESGKVYTLQTKEDVDLLTFQTGENVTYMNLHVTNIRCQGDWYYEVYDADNARILDHRIWGSGGQHDTVLRFEPNSQYTFRIYASKCCGDYRFEYTVSEDLYGDDTAAATPLQPDQKIAASMQRDDDQDYFLIDVQDVQSYYSLTIINSNANWRIYANVYDMYQQKVASVSADLGSTNQTSFKFPAEGQYYIGVSGDMGAYAISYSIVNDPEGDTVTDAMPYEPGAAVQGTLNAGKDVDYFVVAAAEDERTIGVYLDLSLDGQWMNIAVYDQFERALTDFNVYGSNASFTVQQAAGECLYVRLTGDNPSRYVLQLCSPGAHSPEAEWTVTKEPTCTEEGRQDKLCKICHGTDVYQTLPALGHIDGSWWTDTSATCTQEGLEVADCARCYERVFSTGIPMLEHRPGSWTTVSRATCTEDGLNEQRCYDCNILLGTEVIPAYGHKSGDAEIVEATCSNEGTCTIYCTECDIELSSEKIDMVDHTAGSWSQVSNPTCVDAGRREQYCTECNILLNSEDVAAYGHKTGSAEVTDATCTIAGKTEYFCTECDLLLSSTEIPATGHTPGRASTTEATCTTDGKTEQYCAECYVLISSETIPATGHIPGEVETEEPGCTTTGETKQYCTECYECLVEEEIEATGHAQGVWETTLAATCTADGLRTEYCSACNATLSTEVIAAHGHSAAEWQQVQAASCNAKGLKEQRCSVCEAVLATEESDALGHSYTEWEVTIEATKEAEGEKRRHCIHCGDTQFEAIPMIEKFLGIF